MVDTFDAEVLTAYKGILKAQQDVQSSVTALKRALDSDRDPEPARKRLRTKDRQFQDLHAGFKKKVDRSSGQISIPQVQDPASIFDPRLLDGQPAKHCPPQATLPSTNSRPTATFPPTASHLHPASSQYINNYPVPPIVDYNYYYTMVRVYSSVFEPEL